MEYRYIKVIKGVISFTALEDGELIVDNMGLFYRGKALEEGVDSFYIYSDILFCIKNSHTIVFKKRLDDYTKRLSIDKSIVYESASDSNAIFISDFDVDNFSLMYEIIDFNSKSTIHKIGRLPVSNSVFRYGNKCFICYDKNIICLVVGDVNFRWNLNLDSRIDKVIALWQKHLIVACSDHLLLLVDIHTGEIVTKWQELKGFEAGSFFKDVLPNPSNFVLDNAANKLIGTFDVYYFEIDLITKQISYENIETELHSHGIISFHSMGNNPFTDDHLFLIGHVRDKEMPDIDFNCVLALNRQTRRVDWHYTFKDTTIGPNVPQITDTHLYLRDIGNNLYIFEKQ